MALLLASSLSTLTAQNCAVRVNTLGLATGTLNAGVDITISDTWSIDLSAYYNPISLDKFRLTTQGAFVGVRKWRFEPHVGSFVGIHTLGVKYDIGDDIERYNGWAGGVGASYGYSWAIATKWNFTIEGGLGLFYMEDKRQAYHTPPLDDIFIYHYKRLILAPSKLEVSFSYLF